jgi:hypothetical protein
MTLKLFINRPLLLILLTTAALSSVLCLSQKFVYDEAEALQMEQALVKQKENEK